MVMVMVMVMVMMMMMMMMNDDDDDDDDVDNADQVSEAGEESGDSDQWQRKITSVRMKFKASH